MDTTKCQFCAGSGYATWAVIYGRANWPDELPILEKHFCPPHLAPLDYDKPYPRPPYAVVRSPCECREPMLAQRRMARILGEAGIPDDCYRFDLASFQALPHMRKAAQFAAAFIEQDTLYSEDQSERTGLLLAGSPGTGKTTLGSLVFLHRIQAGQTGCWIKYHSLVQKARATYQTGYEGPSLTDIRDTVQYARFLMIDDLGSSTRGKVYGEDMVEMMFLIFDHRMAKRLPTLVTSNLSAEQLEVQFGKPVASRIRGLCHALWIDAPDFRLGLDRSQALGIPVGERRADGEQETR